MLESSEAWLGVFKLHRRLNLRRDEIFLLRTPRRLLAPSGMHAARPMGGAWMTLNGAAEVAAGVRDDGKSLCAALEWAGWRGGMAGIAPPLRCDRLPLGVLSAGDPTIAGAGHLPRSSTGETG